MSLALAVLCCCLSIVIRNGAKGELEGVLLCLGTFGRMGGF